MLYAIGYKEDGTITSVGEVNTKDEATMVVDGLSYTDHIPDAGDIINNYIFQNGEFVYSPRPTETEDKTEEEEVTYQ